MGHLRESGDPNGFPIKSFGNDKVSKIASVAALPRNDGPGISRTEGYGRAFVKIQDGCNHACSFCKVVLVRGRSRSRGFHEILEELKRLRDNGYKEIVFAGIQLGAYGLELGARESFGLVALLERAARIEGIERLRLSSIEPTDVRPELIEALRDIPQCAPHLHIPLQSGDDEILKRMNRRYGRAFYLDLISRLKDEVADFSLTLDVMAGFPGEEERHFQNTVHLLQSVRPLKCHVFPYSRRPGTRAAAFPDLPPATVQARVRDLMRASEKTGEEVRESYLGRRMSVLIEKQVGTKANLYQGLTPNYLKVHFSPPHGLPRGSGEAPDSWLGEIVPVDLRAVQGETFFGGC